MDHKIKMHNKLIRKFKKLLKNNENLQIYFKTVKLLKMAKRIVFQPHYYFAAKDSLREKHVKTPKPS